MINLYTSHDKFQKYTLLIYYFSFTPPEGTGPAGYQDDLNSLHTLRPSPAWRHADTNFVYIIGTIEFFL